MNPYRMRYSVYQLSGEECRDGVKSKYSQLYISPAMQFDRRLWITCELDVLEQGMSIAEVYSSYPEAFCNRPIDEDIVTVPPASILVNNECSQLGSSGELDHLGQSIIKKLGARRLTLPELYSQVVPLLQQESQFYATLQKLFLQQHIQIQPAIQKDSHGRLFCMRCLQYDTIQEHDCGACEETESPCYVCSGCAVYGEIRSCIPLISPVHIEKHQMSLNLAVSTVPIYPHPLTDEQHSASEEIRHIVSGGSDCLVWAVCGAGKSELIFQTIVDVIGKGNDKNNNRDTNKNVLLATPRRDVVMELLPRVQRAFPSVTVHAVYGGSVDKHVKAGITIATTHQLLRYQDYAFDLVIIDEIDAFPYAGDAMLHQHAHRLAKQFLYMTATPDADMLKRVERGEVQVVTLFHRHHSYPLPEPRWIRYNGLEAKELDWFIHRVKTKLLKMAKSLHYSIDNKDKYADADTERKTTYEMSPELIDVIDGLPKTGVVMFFVPSIEKGKTLLKLLEGYLPEKCMEGVGVTFVYAKDPQRGEKIQGLRQGKYRWIVTTTILERGVTIPDSHVVVIDAHHPVFSKSTLIQIAGRVGRTIEYPQGKVIFIGKYLTKSIQMAMKEIRQVNQSAQRMLKDDRDGIKYRNQRLV